MKKIITSVFVVAMILFFSRAVLAKIMLPDSEKKPRQENSSPSKVVQAKECFQRAVEYSKLRKVDQAIGEYRKCLELDPNLAMAYVNLGMSYIQKKETDAAIKELKKAIEKSPKLKLAHFNLWWAYRQQGKYEQGIDELKKVIAIDPNDASVYQNLGDTYLSDKKMIPQAIQAYSQGLSKNKKTVSLYQKMGKAYELNRQWDKAVEQFQKAVKLDERNLYNYLFLYVTLKKAGRDSEANKAVQKGLTSFWATPPQSGSPVEKIVHLLEYLAGTYAEKDLLASKSRIILCQANYYVGMNYLFQKKNKEAIQYFKQAIDTHMHFISEYEYAKIELERLQK